ncbi:5-(carboxyamino)imidazole ribonucleotide synthase [Schaalia sp. Marseille-Q2122]|uniref:5-(carboxyamino)imidazole ribonucleotide synthase n=1 Tax=Schaalia sp. Marseille-Q2122 TaxID=2736604 RepID=UPI00158ADB90|nr:5-(carboxyamino)imidazole ribonucleotide synthase [Schaalia sp. Marseille-Q2122]
MHVAKTSPRPVVAVIGGGQLARMMQESAIALGIELRALVEATNGSAGQSIVAAPAGAPADIEAVGRIAAGADVLTFEHEHIPAATFEAFAAHLPIHPSQGALLYAQDKLAMRARLTELGLPCPAWERIETPGDLQAFGDAQGWPVVVKTPRGGYDGRGVRLVNDANGVDDWLAAGGPLLAEACVPFIGEVAALLARRPSGEVRAWPVAQTEQRDGVCAVVTAPAPNLSEELGEQAQEIAATIARELDVTGVLAVEMFLAPGEDGQLRLLVNELAMRPHNSGHWTIEGAVTSQFEQHLRAVLDLPLGDTSMRAEAAVMVNLLGSAYEDPSQGLTEAMSVAPAAKIHLYGKEVRPGRKLGHVTVCSDSREWSRITAHSAIAALSGPTLEG